MEHREKALAFDLQPLRSSALRLKGRIQYIIKPGFQGEWQLSVSEADCISPCQIKGAFSSFDNVIKVLSEKCYQNH